jgi:hypothetical protein
VYSYERNVAQAVVTAVKHNDHYFDDAWCNNMPTSMLWNMSSCKYSLISSVLNNISALPVSRAVKVVWWTI